MGKTYRRPKNYWDDDTDLRVKGKVRSRKKQSKILKKLKHRREVDDRVDNDEE